MEGQSFLESKTETSESLPQKEEVAAVAAVDKILIMEFEDE